MTRKQKQQLIEKYEKAARKVVSLYSDLPEVVSVVIGGSLARGFTDIVSDIEMYVYYEKSIPSEENIRKILKKLNAKLIRSKKIHWYHSAWGYHTFFAFNGIKFELGYRDIHEFFARMQDFKSGLILPKHGIHDTPFGHYESGVASCISESKILIDKKGQLQELKDYLSDYSSSHLRDETFQYYIKDAKTITTMKTKYATMRNDHYNFNACVARSIRSLVICIFALNNRYYPGDKFNGRYIDTFEIKPKNFKKRMADLFNTSDYKKEDKQNKYNELLKLIKETEKLYERT
ncbi:DUF4037 domain-containing protein [Patescibacteria group bacterium]|nr:DUF4037 domain-containing protein [Patescibacteria group bacterium]MBU1256787.1 DUF4037 domain-containing protein [Patescibacteria group bacterium]MBU1457643.1 DUF4037 domain-containing protein [Patescibacteria group bacterium]